MSCETRDEASEGEGNARPRLIEYLVTGLVVAVGLSLVAAIPLGVLLIASFLGGDLTPPGVLVAMLVIDLSYVAMSLIGAVALWLFFPLKQSLIGWMIRAAVLAPIAYGVVGVSLAVLYDHLGVNLADFASSQEAWDLVWSSLPFWAVFGALIGGPVVYFQDKKSRKAVRS